MPAQATWTITDYPQNGSTHKISDGNWEIGVYKYSDDNWNLGKATGYNGSGWIAGSGVLDLRNVAADCGVVLKASNNGALESNTGIVEVFFPDSFETMHGNTFKNDTALTNVVLGASMKTIGAESFRNCSGLRSVNFPDGLQTVGGYAFYGCSVLELDNFTFPSSLASIGDHGFTGCRKFAGTMTFPGLASLSGTYQFEDCVAMTEFVAPNLVMTAQGMFNRCTALASASFSPDLSSIGTDAFNNSGALVSFYPTTMPKLTSFGNNGLRGHKKLVADFDLSQSPLASLGSMAFVDGEKIGTIKLPETLATLGNYSLAFNNASRVVWFCGPPPTSIESNALEPKNSKKWVLVAGVKHAAEWKADEHLIALADGESATALAAAKALGLSGVRPIGKWTYQANASTHWVVEELPAPRDADPGQVVPLSCRHGGLAAARKPAPQTAPTSCFPFISLCAILFPVARLFSPFNPPTFSVELQPV